MSSLSRIAFVLVFLLSTAYTADDNRLTIYTAQTGYSITIVQIQNTPYVGLVDVLDPLGRTETKIDGNKFRLMFTPPGASPREFEFQAGNKTYKTSRDKPELTASFAIQNERGYIPVASLPALLASLLDQQIQFHENARRLFLSGAPTRFTAELRKDATSSLVLRFQKPVNPFIATEPGKLHMVFTRDPVIATGAENLTFTDPLISAAIFEEHGGLAELTVNATSPLIASFSDGGRIITLTAAPTAQPAAQAANEQSSAPVAESPAVTPATPVVPLAPRAPNFLVVVDPAHGGDERGAALSNTLQEKDVTLALARRIAGQLEAKGITAILIRSGDSTNSLDQRAAAANSMRPALYIAVHAVSLGQGSSVFTAQLPPSTIDRRAFLPWNSAQSAYLDLSSVAGGSIAAELNTRKVPVRATSASVRPLNNVAAPAVAIEVSPLSSDVSTLTSADYQQRIAGAIAAGVSAVRNKLEAAR
jgi:N-acetylmuramoyl-L-alanine amidase